MAKLSKDDVVRAGLRLLDEAGIEGLTVRALADRLGVKAPALYWHVRDKQELLDEMATEAWREVVRELDALPPDADWETALRAFAHACRRMLLSRRDGARVFSGTYMADAGLLRDQEAPLAWMGEQGFSLAATVRAYSLVTSFTVGFCIEEQAVSQAEAAGDPRYSLEERDARVGAAEHPLVARAGREIFGNPDARFAEQLDVLIDAVARMRGRGGAGETPNATPRRR